MDNKKSNKKITRFAGKTRLTAINENALKLIQLRREKKLGIYDATEQCQKYVTKINVDKGFEELREKNKRILRWIRSL